MARIRSVKPELWSDEKLAEVPREVRLTFIGLISACADDAGRLKGQPRVIRGMVYPLDDDMSAALIEEHLTQLAHIGVIQRYEVNGEQYIHIVNWKIHQKIDRPSPSRLPPPPRPARRGFDERTASTRRDLASERSGADAEGIGEDGKGAERMGLDEPSPIPADPDPLDRDEPAPPAPLRLPPHAERLVTELYGLSTGKRQLDVKQQLYDTITPNTRGARLTRGVYVKARDLAHLDEVCRQVLYDPPREYDAAIVYVLKKLQDPPPGPSPAELAAKREADDRAIEEEYNAAMRNAGLAWMREHPTEYEAIRKPIDAQFASAGTSIFAKHARDQALASATAKAASFPSYEQWLRARNGQRAPAMAGAP